MAVDTTPADTGTDVEGSYLACMEHCLLGEGLLDPLLVGLSDTYELLRSVAVAWSVFTCLR